MKFLKYLKNLNETFFFVNLIELLNMLENHQKEKVDFIMTRSLVGLSLWNSSKLTRSLVGVSLQNSSKLTKYDESFGVLIGVINRKKSTIQGRMFLGFGQ